MIFVTKKRVDEELDITLQYMDLTTDSIEEVRSNCQKFINERDDWESEAYGKNRDERLIRKYNTESMENIPNTNLYLKKPDYKAESLNDSELVNNVKFIQFRFESGDKTMIFGRRFTQSKVLSHGKRMLREISGTLKLFDDKIMELPEDYDFCKYNDDVLIFHPDSFEDFFDYHDVHTKYYKTVFNHISKKADYTIVDFDKYSAQALEHPQKLRKLPAIEEKKMYLWSFNQIQDFLNRRPISTVELDVKNKRIKFKTVFAMMDFYNDAHLTSEATDTKYLAQNKSKE